MMPKSRYPLSIAWDAYPVKITGISFSDFFTDPDMAYDAIKCTNTYFRLGNTGGYNFAPGIICADFGGKMRFPDNALPVEEVFPIRSAADIEKLQIPAVGSCPSYTYEKKVLQRMTSDRQSPGIYISSILERASHLMGCSELLTLMRKDPAHFDMLMEKLLIFTIGEIQYYANEFADDSFWISSAYSLESNDVMSPRDFSKYCAPYITKLYEKLKIAGFNNQSICLCGNHLKNLPFWNSIGLPEGTSFTLDPCMDAAACIPVMHSDYYVECGVDKEALSHASPDEVYSKAKSLIETYRNRDGGFALSADCSIPYDAPEENIFALIAAAEDCAD